MMQALDGIKISGRTRFRIRDLLTGELEITPWKHNLVTTAGMVLYASLLRGTSAAHCAYCAVGSDDTAADVGDTALAAEIGRLAITDTSISTATVTYSTFFGSADCNGAWNEVGLLTESVGGTLICRNVLAAEQTKNAANTITIDYALEVEAP